MVFGDTFLFYKTHSLSQIKLQNTLHQTIILKPIKKHPILWLPIQITTQHPFTMNHGRNVYLLIMYCLLKYVYIYIAIMIRVFTVQLRCCSFNVSLSSAILFSCCVFGALLLLRTTTHCPVDFSSLPIFFIEHNHSYHFSSYDAVSDIFCFIHAVP